MNKGQMIEQTFQNVSWKGSSNIHRSWAAGFNLDEPTVAFFLKSSPKEVMRVLARANYHLLVMRQIAGSNLQFEPFMSEDEFNKLVYYLTMRSLLGQKPTMRGKRIVNPDTKNVFIPLGVNGPCVAAIRFWAGSEETVEGDFALGFRIRCEVVAADEAHGRARKAIEEMQKITEEVQEYDEIANYTEVAEPILEEEAGLRVRIRTE